MGRSGRKEREERKERGLLLKLAADAAGESRWSRVVYIPSQRSDGIQLRIHGVLVSVSRFLGVLASISQKAQ